jgi:hypothetical protein
MLARHARQVSRVAAAGPEARSPQQSVGLGNGEPRRPARPVTTASSPRVGRAASRAPGRWPIAHPVY